MSQPIRIEPLTSDAFSRYGDVLDATGDPDKIINRGACGRWHDRARLEMVDGHPGISLFRAKPRALPYRLDMMERHPRGSQAFLPMSLDPFLILVADNHRGRPAGPRAFLSAAGQGVNYRRGTWHGVLTPLHEPGLFAVVDRIGADEDLEEFWFDEPFTIEGDENMSRGPD